MTRSTSDIVCFTYVSADDFWQVTALELKEHLAAHGLDLVIHTEPNHPAGTYLERYKHYRRKDQTFVDFASQESRRCWLLDAEVRLIRSLPSSWLERNESVLFYTDHNSIRGYPAVNTGQSIWAQDMIPIYRESIDLANEIADEDTDILYDVEDVIPLLQLPKHMRALISTDRRNADPAAECSKGTFINGNTCLIHPHQHNFSQEYNQTIVSWSNIPRLKERDFLNHFSPLDFPLAQHVFELVLNKDDSMDSWFDLDLDGFEDTSLSTFLSKIVPSQLSFVAKYAHAKCYALQGWIFCPALSLAAPKDEWYNRAYQLITWPIKEY